MAGQATIWGSAHLLDKSLLDKALLDKHDKFECQPRDQQNLPVRHSELCPLSARKPMLKVKSAPACRLAIAVPTQPPLAWYIAIQD